MSADFALTDEAIFTVRARSCAEMPVLMPSAASIETVKLVPWRERFCSTIGLRPRRLACSSVIGMQIRPRPCLARKLIFSGVTNSAAKTRSPSFSRSSSSTRITMSPARIAAMISAIGAMAAVSLRIARILRLFLCRTLFGRSGALADARRLARACAQVVELRAAHIALALHLDRGDERRVGLESALDAFARGDLAHDERRVETAVALGDHHAFECLHALALAFDHVHVDDHGVARREVGNAAREALDLFLLESPDEIHALAPVFVLEFLQQFLFLCAELTPRDQLGPPQPGPAERLLQPPAPDVLVVPGEQHLGHSFAAVHLGPRVLRTIEQSVGERLLECGGLVAERAGQLAHAGVDQRHRRELSAREHEVADRQLFVR